MKPRKPVSTTAARRARGLVTNERMSAVAQSKRAGKYNAKGTFIHRLTLAETHAKDPDRIWFASAAEATRFLQLKELEAKGVIERLKLQPTYILTVNGVHVCTYRADFSYQVPGPRAADTYGVTEDVKGMITDVYDLKKKLVEALHRIVVTEIPSKQVKQWHMRIPDAPA